MYKRYRDISKDSLAIVFVQNILEISGKRNIQTAVNQIVQAETGIEQVSACPTITHADFRSVSYSTEEARRKLRDQIFSELTTMTRLENADDIRLKKGGCLPRTNVQQNKHFYIVVGLPASGKSFLADLICDDTGSLLLDSDYAKRKLPEFYNKKNGATLVHKESRVIIMGSGSNKAERVVFEWGLSQGLNMVFPCIGNDLEEIVKLSQVVTRDHGYNKPHLILVNLDRVNATKRAYNRYKATKRYVPLSKIYDEYANDSALTYYKAQEQYADLFESFTHVDTNVSINERYKIIFRTEKSPVHPYSHWKN